MALPRPRYNAKRKRKRTSKFKQGVYFPVNESKYKAAIDTTMNNTNGGMIYRSSWELAFAKYLDGSKEVTMWGSESFAIAYISPKDGQPHRYYIDFMFVKNNKKVLVEIKPHNQRGDPVNIAKWAAAEKYAKQIGAEFFVVTEKHLKSWGLI